MRGWYEVWPFAPENVPFTYPKRKQKDRLPFNHHFSRIMLHFGSINELQWLSIYNDHLDWSDPKTGYFAVSWLPCWHIHQHLILTSTWFMKNEAVFACAASMLHDVTMFIYEEPADRICPIYEILQASSASQTIAKPNKFQQLAGPIQSSSHPSLQIHGVFVGSLPFYEPHLGGIQIFVAFISLTHPPSIGDLHV